MAVHESREDYLESILLLSRNQRDVHSVEVARRLGVSKPTITKAVKILVQEGLVRMDGVHLVLTDLGRETAEKIYEKHTVIREFLRLHGVEDEAAERDACRMEHIVGDETFSMMCEYVKNADKKS